MAEFLDLDDILGDEEPEENTGNSQEKQDTGNQADEPTEQPSEITDPGIADSLSDPLASVTSLDLSSLDLSSALSSEPEPQVQQVEKPDPRPTPVAPEPVIAPAPQQVDDDIDLSSLVAGFEDPIPVESPQPIQPTTPVQQPQPHVDMNQNAMSQMPVAQPQQNFSQPDSFAIGQPQQHEAFGYPMPESQPQRSSQRGRGAMTFVVVGVAALAIVSGGFFAASKYLDLWPFGAASAQSDEQSAEQVPQSTQPQEHSKPEQPTTPPQKDQTAQSAQPQQPSGESLANSTNETKPQIVQSREQSQMQSSITDLIKETAEQTKAKNKEVSTKLLKLEQKARGADVSDENIDYLAEQIILATQQIEPPKSVTGKGEVLSVETSIQGNTPVLVVVTSEPTNISLVANVNGKIVLFGTKSVSGVATFALDQDPTRSSGAYAYIVKSPNNELTGVRTY